MVYATSRPRRSYFSYWNCFAHTCKTCAVLGLTYTRLLAKHGFGKFWGAITVIHAGFNYTQEGGKLVPRKQGCAFLYRLCYWSTLAYFIGDTRVRFFNTDKLKQKEFVQRLGVKIPKTLSVLNASQILETGEIPQCDFVLKPTNSFKSRGLFIRKGKIDIVRNKPFIWSTVQEKIKQLQQKKVVTDSAYVFEELLTAEDGDTCPPPLYKFFVLGNQILRILYISQYDINTHKAGIAGVTEEYIHFQDTWCEANEFIDKSCALPPKPECWNEMLSAVKLIGDKVKIFTRVDFFATSQGAVFGEFSFGWSPNQWTPQCSHDLNGIYNKLPANQKALMIPDPFLYAIPEDAKQSVANPYGQLQLDGVLLGFIHLTPTI
mmetsp:Transcript_20750/g.70612  ORF Transcript_20750/g.70612 Transcript_20750/m.70612 type:complete len:375 (+) Transcript_20750:91-1215(+)